MPIERRMAMLHAVADEITRHDGVDATTLTGETRTGAAIMEAAGGIRDVSFELGGKNAGIVVADCNFDDAVKHLPIVVHEHRPGH